MSISNCCLNNICSSLNTLFFVFLQFLFVLFAGMLLHDQTLGKPLKSQELKQRDHNITEGELEASHAVNGTSGIRVKRDLSDCSGFLKTYCGPITEYLPPRNDCEIGRYICLSYPEAVCRKTFSWASSIACSRNIYQHGKPKCSPKYRKAIINTSQGTKCVRRTEYCSC